MRIWCLKVTSFGSLSAHALDGLVTPIWTEASKTGELDAWGRMRKVVFSFGLTCVLMQFNVLYFFFLQYSLISRVIAPIEFLVILELVTLLSTQKEAEIDVTIVLIDTSLLYYPFFPLKEKVKLH